ncbi:hypothetical protein EDB89DRAFT_2028856 [Lactarius sanguifluus]|nr:hypothetical protein EDB89DRAFT_2028856 [Lactarius sanguifluus]
MLAQYFCVCVCYLLDAYLSCHLGLPTGTRRDFASATKTLIENASRFRPFSTLPSLHFARVIHLIAYNVCACPQHHFSEYT